MADGFLLLPPGGAQAGLVRLREKLAPLTMRALVDGAVREAAGGETKVGPLRRFHTYEGEAAGIVTLEIDLGGAHVERTLALVASDDLCAVFDGLATRADTFESWRAAVLELARSYYMGLGELRRRRFEYAPPPGWHGVGRPYVTAWYAPGYPNEAAFLQVFDARPLAENPVEVDDRLLTIENQRLEPIASAPIAPGRELSGHLLRASVQEGGRTVHVVRARLVDERFLYLVQLHADDDALETGLAALDALVASVEPIPKAGPAPPAHLRHWID
jgi:hypothetical protein